MPIIEITISEGRDAKQLRSLLAEVHEAVGRALDDPALPIRVIIREIPPRNWLSEGLTLAERALQ